MDWILRLNGEQINRLDLQPAHAVVEQILRDPAAAVQQVRCQIEFPRSPDDPREWPEIPEVRLWFIRCDSCYPWLVYFLNWRAGELARYAAMLVPHQFTVKEGIQFHPEGLEIFLMHKLFVLIPWLRQHGLERQEDLRHMAQLLGYDIDPALFALV